MVTKVFILSGKNIGCQTFAWSIIVSIHFLLFTAELEGEGVEEVKLDALRATEYEQLARLCMDEKQ